LKRSSQSTNTWPYNRNRNFFLPSSKTHSNKFKGATKVFGVNYVRNTLYGWTVFELLMASYAVAHLQMDLILALSNKPHLRNNVWNVTNSLEEGHPDTDCYLLIG
jgi:hypothetical protein